MKGKIAVCNFFAQSTNMPLNKNRVYFVTAAGLISGYLASGDDADVCADYHAAIVKSACGVNEEDGVIVLRDATIENNGYKTNAGSLVVFADSVIGVFVGTVS